MRTKEFKEGRAAYCNGVGYCWNLLQTSDKPTEVLQGIIEAAKDEQAGMESDDYFE